MDYSCETRKPLLLVFTLQPKTQHPAKIKVLLCKSLRHKLQSLTPYLHAFPYTVAALDPTVDAPFCSHGIPLRSFPLAATTWFHTAFSQIQG